MPKQTKRRKKPIHVAIDIYPDGHAVRKIPNGVQIEIRHYDIDYPAILTRSDSIKYDGDFKEHYEEYIYDAEW